MPSKDHALIDVNDSLLIVIDVQDFFLQQLDDVESRSLLSRIKWIIDVAVRLDVPIVVTAENIPVYGSVCEELQDRLPAETEVFNKMIFELAAEPEIMKRVESIGRGTAVLVGMTTDCCVSQSAIGLSDKGYRVAILTDGVAAPGTGQEYGITRMRDAGIVISSVKGIFYEWLRDVASTEAFEKKHLKEIGVPESIKTL